MNKEILDLSLDEQINIVEANNFNEGRKLVAIISDAGQLVYILLVSESIHFDLVRF